MRDERKKGAIKRIVVSVKEVNGCSVHQPGDQVVFDCVGEACVSLRGTICLGALTSLMPKVYAFHNRARFRRSCPGLTGSITADWPN